MTEGTQVTTVQKTVQEDPDHWWEEVDWAGACAFVLATGIALSLILGFVRWAIQGAQLSQQGATVLSTLGGATIGAVATYLGRSREMRERRTTTTTIEPTEQEHTDGS